MKLPALMRRYLLVVLLLLIPITVVAITVAAIYTREHALQSTLRARQTQLKAYREYQEFLTQVRPTQTQPLRYDWQIADWANSLSLELTLQPLNKARSALSVSAEGPLYALQQLLQLIAQHSLDKRWQQGWQLQRISWSSVSAIHHRLNWQVIARPKQRQADVPMVAAPTHRSNLPEASACQTPPVSVPSQSPRLNQLQPIAIVQPQQTSPGGLIYWRTADGQHITTGLNDWFIDPIAQITDIQLDRIQLKQWLQVNNCWLTRTYDHYFTGA